MKKLLLTLSAGVLLAPAVAPAQDADVDINGQRERWYYTSNPCNGAAGSECTNRAEIGMWATDPETTVYQYRASVALLEFDVELPAGADPLDYEVTEATITVWSRPNQPWQGTGPDATQFELFALGYNPQGFTDPVEDPFYTRETFNVANSPFIGSSNFAFAVRDPFARNLADDSNADMQESGATPWAIGDYDGTLVGPDEPPLPITFTLDVSDPKIQQQLKDDIEFGQTRWYVWADELIGGMGSPIPRIYTSAASSFEGDATPPVLTLKVTVEEPTSVSNWIIFE